MPCRLLHRIFLQLVWVSKVQISRGRRACFLAVIASSSALCSQVALIASTNARNNSNLSYVSRTFVMYALSEYNEIKPGGQRRVSVQVSGLYAITLGSVARYGKTSSSLREGSPITMILPGSARQGKTLVSVIDSRYIITSWLEHVAGHLHNACTRHLKHHLSATLE
jgi:hypothetical protein